MSEPSTPVAWLAANARRHPGRPCLFYRGLLDWRWRSWAQLADQAARIAEGWRTRPAGSSIELNAGLDPDRLTADWAAQAAGLVVRPVSDRAELPWPEVGGRPVEPAAALATDRATAGGAWVTGPVNAGERLLRAPSLREAVRCLSTALPRLPTSPILLVAGDRMNVTVRVAMAWAMVEAAVVVLEPDLAAVAEATLWTRPHVVVAPPSALATTRVAVRAQKPRWRRLRVVVPTVSSPADTPSVAEDSAWRRLGVSRRQAVAGVLWSLADRDPSPSA